MPPYRETRNYVRKMARQTTKGLPVPRNLDYKTVEIVDGRQVARYSDSPPASGPYGIMNPSRQ